MLFSDSGESTLMLQPAVWISSADERRQQACYSKGREVFKKKKEAYKGNLAGVESRVKNISCTASAEIERYSFISGFYHTYLSGGWTWILIEKLLGLPIKNDLLFLATVICRSAEIIWH